MKRKILKYFFAFVFVWGFVSNGVQEDVYAETVNQSEDAKGIGYAQEALILKEENVLVKRNDTRYSISL